MQSAEIKQDYLVVRHEVEKFKEEVAALKTQLEELEQENLRSSPLFQKLGRHFGFGAAGKLDWMRFKLNYKQEGLALWEAEQALLDIAANRSNLVPELEIAPPAGFRM